MTILEILMSTMLLGMVAVIVFSAFGIGLRAAALANSLSTATSIAEETLAQVTASPCGSSFTQPISQELEDPRLARFRREVHVGQAPGTNMWEMSVTVHWTQERAPRSITVTTLRHVSAACGFVGR